MRSLMVTAPGRVEWRELPAPQLQGEKEAIVTPVAGSRCDYDRDLARGASRRSMPFSIGHEAVARVVEVGDRVTRVAPGDLAVVVWHINCGECDRCRAGMTARCERVPLSAAYGGGEWGALFDDFVRVAYADAMLTPLPPGLDPIEATGAGDSVGLAHAVMSRQPNARDQSLAIFGRGEHGLYQVAFAKEAGFPSILYVDESRERRAVASALGADATAASPLEAGDRVDVIVDAAGNEAWLHDAIGILKPEGLIESLGGYFDDFRLPGLLSYFNGATIRCGAGNNGPHVAPTLDAIARGVVQPSRTWALQVAWDDLPAAYADEPRKLLAVRPD